MNKDNIINKIRERHHESCVELVEKLTILQKNRIVINRKISQFGNLNTYRYWYYTDCDELNEFIKNNNQSANNVKIRIHDKKVSTIYTTVDIKSNEATYDIK